jgi:hypothetical protein
MSSSLCFQSLTFSCHSNSIQSTSRRNRQLQTSAFSINKNLLLELYFSKFFNITFTYQLTWSSKYNLFNRLFALFLRLHKTSSLREHFNKFCCFRWYNASLYLPLTTEIIVKRAKKKCAYRDC